MVTTCIPDSVLILTAALRRVPDLFIGTLCCGLLAGMVASAASLSGFGQHVHCRQSKPLHNDRLRSRNRFPSALQIIVCVMTCGDNQI
ncbi:hypothetical protein [Thioclava sp. GXIMD4215]|uniref:hypothetical protein n=1 Tax=Thioclava sp. GXIMD4215 TaxID=3131928 RepID=UPI003873B64F